MDRLKKNRQDILNGLVVFADDGCKIVIQMSIF